MSTYQVSFTDYPLLLILFTYLMLKTNKQTKIMELQRECSLKGIDYAPQRSPPGSHTRLTSGRRAQGGSSREFLERPRRTPSAAWFGRPGSPRLPSCRPGPPGPRDGGSLRTWFLSSSCPRPPPRDLDGAPRSRDCPPCRRGSAVPAAVSSGRLRVAVSSFPAAPPRPAAAWGCPRLPGPFQPLGWLHHCPGDKRYWGEEAD